MAAKAAGALVFTLGLALLAFGVLADGVGAGALRVAGLLIVSAGILDLVAPASLSELVRRGD